MRRTWVRLALVGLALAGLLGCGGSSKKNDDAQQGDATSGDGLAADLFDISAGGDLVVTFDTVSGDTLALCEPPQNPPATGNCSGEADRNALATADPPTSIGTCLARHGEPLDADALGCCLQSELTITPNCSACFRELAICQRNNCQNECEFGSSETCRNCADQKGCSATFEACAGTTLGGEDTISPDTSSDALSADTLGDSVSADVGLEDTAGDLVSVDTTSDLEPADLTASDSEANDSTTTDAEPGDGEGLDTLDAEPGDSEALDTSDAQQADLDGDIQALEDLPDVSTIEPDLEGLDLDTNIEVPDGA